jgi:hypothetical protein
MARTESGKLVLTLDLKKPVHEFFFVRVMEALSFALARRLYWNFVEEYRERKVVRRVRGEKQSDERHLPLAVSELDFACGRFTWDLFAKYLAFIYPHQGGGLHPCSGQLFAVYQAKQGTIESQALALGVAVEGLCRVLFPDYFAAPANLKKWVKSLRAHCESWDGFDDPTIRQLLFNRLIGFLGALKSSREKDTLVQLVAEGSLYVRHVKAWGELRHPAAHGATQGARPMQELVDLCHSVTVLIYHIIFKAIGYTGIYTDYSVYGFPLRRYRGRWPTAEEIAVAAYFLYIKEPEQHGKDVDHWLVAEAMLKRGEI